MAQPKGKTGNPNGRPVGSQNAKTKQWEALGEAIMTRHTDRFNGLLDSMPDDKFIQNYKDVLDYFQPRLARTENVNQNDNETTIRFEFSDSYAPKTSPKTGGIPPKSEEV